MLFLELGEAEMESRLIKRGATRPLHDNAETIRKRRTFNADSMPVIEELQKLDAVRFVPPTAASRSSSACSPPSPESRSASSDVNARRLLV